MLCDGWANMPHTHGCKCTTVQIQHGLHRQCLYVVPARANTGPSRSCKLVAAPVGRASRVASSRHPSITQCTISQQQVSTKHSMWPAHVAQGLSQHHNTISAPLSSDGCSKEVNSTEPGLLQLADVHSPDDLLHSAQAAAEHCSTLLLQVQKSFPGMKTVLQLVDAEQALQRVLRPARYVLDYHPQAAWRDAAAKALTTATHALNCLQSNHAAIRLLQATQAHLQTQCHDAAIAGMKGVRQGADYSTESMPAPTPGTNGTASWAQAAHTSDPAQVPCDQQAAKEEPSQRQAWLRAVTHLLRSWTRASQALHDELQQLQQQERECAAALRTLLISPAAAPRLLLSGPQAELLSSAVSQDTLLPLSSSYGPWTRLFSQHAQNGGVEEYDSRTNVAAQAADRFQRLVQDLYTHAGLKQRRLRLYGDTHLDLAMLDAASDAVLDAAGDGGSSSSSSSAVRQQQTSGLISPTQIKEGLWLLCVTQPVLVALLQQHPNEGVRWQVHHAVLQPLAMLQCQVLDHLTRIRNEIARLQGLASHSHAVLDCSLLQHPSNAAQFLMDVGTGLQPLLAHQLQHMAKVGRRAGLGVNTFTASQAMRQLDHHSNRHGQQAGRQATSKAVVSPSQEGNSLWGLQPWDVDYARHLQVQATQLRDVAGTRRGAMASTGWEQYGDYFTLGNVLQGLNKLLGRTLGLHLQPTRLTSADVSWLLSEEQHTAKDTAAAAAADDDNSSSSSNVSSSIHSKTNSSIQSSSVTGSAVAVESAILLCFQVVSMHNSGCSASTTRGFDLGEHSDGGVQVGQLYLHVHSNPADYPFTTLLSPGHDAVSTATAHSTSMYPAHASDASHQGSAHASDASNQGLAHTSAASNQGLAHARAASNQGSAQGHPAAGQHGHSQHLEENGVGSSMSVPVVLVRMGFPLDSCPSEHDVTNYSHLAPQHGLSRQQTQTTGSTGTTASAAQGNATPATALQAASSDGRRLSSQAGDGATKAARAWTLQRLGHRIMDPLHLSMLLHELGHALQYILSSSPAEHRGIEKQQQQDMVQQAEERHLQEQLQVNSKEPVWSSASTHSGHGHAAAAAVSPLSSNRIAVFDTSRDRTAGVVRGRESRAGVMGGRDETAVLAENGDETAEMPERSSWDTTPLPAYLRSAMHWPLDWREVAAHVTERWARDPAALQLLSQHARLGTPLTAHDAARAAALVGAATVPGGHLEVWEQVRAALAEQLMYAGICALPGQGAANSNGNAASTPSVGTHGNQQGHSHQVPSALTAHTQATQVLLGMQPPADSSAFHAADSPAFHAARRGPEETLSAAEWLDLQAVACLEQQAVLGGAQVVYVLARLLAAATWCRWLEQDALSSSGGAAVLKLLLQLPAFSCSLPNAVTALLQDTDAVRAVASTGGEQPIAYMPDLAADCWQDIDLVG